MKRIGKYLILCILIKTIIADHCDSGKDCLEDRFCNSNKMCEHKPLFPLSKRDIILSTVIFLTSIIFAPVCVGGEIIYTVSYSLISNFDYKEAGPLSKTNMVVNDLILTLFFMFKNNPDKEKKNIIDYNILLYIIPVNLIGHLIGLIVNKTFPKIIMLFLLTGINAFGAFLFRGKLRDLTSNKPKHDVLLNYLVKEENLEFEKVFRNNEIDILSEDELSLNFKIKCGICFLCTAIFIIFSYVAKYHVSLCSTLFWCLFSSMIFILLLFQYLLSVIWKKENFCQDLYNYGTLKVFLDSKFLFKMFLVSLNYGLISQNLAGEATYLAVCFFYLYNNCPFHSIIASFKIVILYVNSVNLLVNLLNGEITDFKYPSFMNIPVIFGTFFGIYLLNILINTESKRDREYRFTILFEVITIFIFLAYVLYTVEEICYHLFLSLNELFNFKNFCSDN